MFIDVHSSSWASEAYLELQVERKGSFFVYQSDLGILRVEGWRESETGRETDGCDSNCTAFSNALSGSVNANGKRTAPTPAPSHLRLLRLLRQGVYWSASSTNNSN